jgi:hypothetical protein
MKVPLVIFGCVHIGHKNADLKLAKKYVDFVKKRNGFALLLADNHENAIPKKAHMMFDQNLTPQEQLDYSVEMFKPIRKQIIAGCTGNHAGRTTKETSLEMDKIMFQRLGIPRRYHPYQGFTSVVVGKVRYRIAFKHGGGQGSNTFGNASTLHRAFPEADICCASHTHECAATRRGRWRIDRKGKRELSVVTLVNTGCMLDYPRYGDEAGYLPQPKGFTILWLDDQQMLVKPDITGDLDV